DLALPALGVAQARLITLLLGAAIASPHTLGTAVQLVPLGDRLPRRHQDRQPVDLGVDLPLLRAAVGRRPRPHRPPVQLGHPLQQRLAGGGEAECAELFRPHDRFAGLAADPAGAHGVTDPDLSQLPHAALQVDDGHQATSWGSELCAGGGGVRASPTMFRARPLWNAATALICKNTW